LPQGYRELEFGEFNWIAEDAGSRFILGVDNWSPEQLSLNRNWRCWKKPFHDVYLAREQTGKAYLIKNYPPQPGSGRAARGSRATREFFKVVLADRRKIGTILPVAVGERRTDKNWGIIIYPYVDESVTLEGVYSDRVSRPFLVPERHALEKEVGELLRCFIDAGAYPVDAHLDHFLVVREGAACKVVYVDLERIKFDRLPCLFAKKRRMIRTAGRLLARLEWFRASGGKVTAASMMRIVKAMLRQNPAEKSNKKLHRRIIRAARSYWRAREFGARGRYEPRSIPSAKS
jgi:hypothetical protein